MNISFIINTLLSKITDGTNIGNILKSDGTAAGQNALLVAGSGYATSTITLNSSSPNSGWYDMLNYGEVSMVILSNSSNASISPQTTNDPAQSTTTGLLMANTGNGITFTQVSNGAGGTFKIYRNGRYFRISSNVSGGNTITLVLTFYTIPSASSVTNVSAITTTGSGIGQNAFLMGLNLNGNLKELNSIVTNGDGYSGNGSLDTSSRLYNGSNFDRQRNNVNTTTGDTPTITTATTTNGATQTNYNARGAIITAILGTVSGASPSLSLQLQYSPDGGTTWVNYGPASTPLAVATGNTIAIAVYPTILTSSLLGTTTTADNAQINAPLPRTWRIAYISTGTITSIAVSSVQVNYIN